MQSIFDDFFFVIGRLYYLENCRRRWNFEIIDGTVLVEMYEALSFHKLPPRELVVVRWVVYTVYHVKTWVFHYSLLTLTL